MFSSMKSKELFALSIFAGLVCLLSVPLSAQESADNPLSQVPADSLFCVRINNFDNTMALVDKYAEGLSPTPIGLAMMARMPLTQIVGDPMLKNIRFDGDFVIFAAARGTDEDFKKNIFVAAILPVADYETFLREHPNASAPDDNGISKLAPAQGEAKTLVRKAGPYALFAQTSNYDKMVAVSKALSEGKAKTVADVLDRRRTRAAARTPIWAYGNVQRVGEVFGPTIFAGMDKAKAELEKMSAENKGMAPPANVMDIYTQFVKEFFRQVDSITWSITPAADVCRVSNDIKPVDGTDMAAALAGSSTPRGPNVLLPYLGDNAMINLGMKVDKPLLKRFYEDMFTVLKAMSGDAISPENMEKLKRLTNESFDAFGDALAFSAAAAPEAQPPVAMKYVAQVADVAAFNRIMEEETQLTNAGAMDDLYKGMGLKMKFTMKRNAATYKGVSIDAATLNIRGTGANEDMDKAIRAMYGERFEYRWAIVDKLMVYTISGDVDKDIRALIDEVQAGRRTELAKEMTEAMSYLPRAANADAVGTFNLVRMMQMGMNMTQAFPEAGPMPKIDVATESNLAFAARVRNGRILIDYALPRKHLMELKAAIEQIAQHARDGAMEKAEAAPGEQAAPRSVLAPSAAVKKLADGFTFTEGPAADAEGNIYFSDIPNNKVHKYAADGKVTVHRDNTGGANGLYFDKKENLLACCGGDRQVISISPEGKVAVLADKYDGKKLNSPNDLWIDPKGGVYFSDPRYGNRDGMEQDGECVYYITPDGKKVVRVIGDMVRPNGLIGARDGRKLYVADNGAGKTYAYTVNEDGTLSNKTLFAPEGSDGMTIDNEGNIYLTTDAVAVYNPAGEKIETIPVPERPANLTFGGKDRATLFITARTSLYCVDMQVRGL